MRRITAVVCAALLAGTGTAWGALKATTPEKPVPASVTLIEKGEKVAGNVIKYDAEMVVIKNATETRLYKWSDMTPPSRYVLRSKLIDPTSAADWLEQAELAMQCDMQKQAEANVAAAVKLDAASKLKGDAILRAQGAAKPVVASATTPAAPAVVPRGLRPKYQKSTPAEDAKAIAAAKKAGAEVAAKMEVKFGEIQTAHFLIFTDWDPREYEFLKTNCEAAYTAVSRQFEIPVRENVFVGKLPIYMFAKQQVFMAFAAKMDGFPAGRGVLGYFTDPPGEIAHMAMWKPDTSGGVEVSVAEKKWAYVLTHEFTHAFISRYRTERRIPRWLNEGTAEVVAYSQFPKPESRAFARLMAGQPFKFANLFNDRMMPGGEMYPVMQTMVEALIAEDRKGFLAMFDDIKEGMEPEAAMKKHFKAGYAEWEPAWRRYAKKLED